MKKIMSLLLILAMSFSMIACGGRESDEDGAKKYKFGLTASEDFQMSEALKKFDYSTISKRQSKLEAIMKSAVESHLSGNYSLFSDYEKDDADTIDKLVYTMGMEDDDAEKSYLEAGAYHDKTDNKYYQYTVFISKNFSEDSKADMENALKEMSSAYGITVSRDKVEKAAEEAMKKVPESEEGYYCLYEEKNLKGDGYTERVNFSVEGFATEEEQIGYYISVERERCYN